MKTKRIPALILAVLLLLGATGAAAAGSSSDPLVSLSYITGAYTDSILDLAQAAVDRAFASAGSSGTSNSTAALPGRFTVHNLGAGSTVDLSTGGSVVVWSGNASIAFSSGAVIDVTEGREISSGAALTRSSRYMAAEDTRAVVTLSTACVVAIDGAASVTAGSGKTTHFIDVYGHDWYFDYVVSAVERGLINGKTADTYVPAGSLTLAETVKLAAVMHQLYHTGKVSLTGSGLNWYTPYVEYAVANRIVDAAFLGYDRDAMNSAVSRREFVDIFYDALPESRYTAINSVADNAIPDVKTGDANASEIYTFYRAGILTGSDGYGTFHPADGILRREVAAILSRMFDDSLRQSITLS